MAVGGVRTRCGGRRPVWVAECKSRSFVGNGWAVAGIDRATRPLNRLKVALSTYTHTFRAPPLVARAGTRIPSSRRWRSSRLPPRAPGRPPHASSPSGSYGSSSLRTAGSWGRGGWRGCAGQPGRGRRSGCGNCRVLWCAAGVLVEVREWSRARCGGWIWGRFGGSVCLTSRPSALRTRAAR